MKVLLALLVAIATSACGEGNNQPPPTPTKTAVAPKPSHYYSIHDGAEYGYEQAISEDGRRQGQAASKLMMFKFLGERNSVLQFHTKDGNDIHIVIQCERPCEFAKQMIFYRTKLQRKEHIRASEGSIAWALAQDAMNGYLTQFTKERDGTPSELWIEEHDGPKWRPIPAKN